MKRISEALFIYVYFVYINYIQEDFSEWYKLGKIVIKPFWFIKILYMVIYSIVCFPLVLIHIEIDKNKELFDNLVKRIF